MPAALRDGHLCGQSAAVWRSCHELATGHWASGFTFPGSVISLTKEASGRWSQMPPSAWQGRTGKALLHLTAEALQGPQHCPSACSLLGERLLSGSPSCSWSRWSMLPPTPLCVSFWFAQLAAPSPSRAFPVQGPPLPDDFPDDPTQPLAFRLARGRAL